MRALIILFIFPVTRFGFTRSDSSSFLEVKLNPTLFLSGNSSLTIEKSICKYIALEATGGYERNWTLGSANPFWRYSQSVPDWQVRGGLKCYVNNRSYLYFYSLFKWFEFNDESYYEKGNPIYETGKAKMKEGGVMFGSKYFWKNLFEEIYLGFGYRLTEYEVWKGPSKYFQIPPPSNLFTQHMITVHLGFMLGYHFSTRIR